MSGYGVSDKQAERESLILTHLPQVRLIAHRLHERLPYTVNLDDLISAGIIGLIAAIDNFDPSQGVKLRTYAECKIRGAMLDSLRDLDWAPRERRKTAKEIERAMYRCSQHKGREAVEEEIASELGVSLQEYRKMLIEVQGLDLLHLEHPVSGGRQLLRFVADPGAESPAATFERKELEELVATAIQRLRPEEQTILNLYYNEELTLREIGEILGVHLVRVSQLKTQALLRIKTSIESAVASPEAAPTPKQQTGANNNGRLSQRQRADNTQSARTLHGHGTAGDGSIRPLPNAPRGGSGPEQRIGRGA